MVRMGSWGGATTCQRSYNDPSMHLSRVVFSLSLLIAPAAFSQQIIVKALNGRNDHPLKNARIDIWFGERVSGVPRQSKTGQDGTTLVTVPEGERTFVAAGEFIADCRGGNVAGKSFIDRNIYSIDQVLSTGLVGENQCGKATAQPVRGTFTFFLRPLHWWESCTTKGLYPPWSG
jgi:hypothetical protein